MRTGPLPFTFSSSGYRGVTWDAEKQKYAAEIGNRDVGTRKRLGRFLSAEDAALAYDAAAVDLYGDKAVLNFPGNHGVKVKPCVNFSPECAAGHSRQKFGRVSPSGYLSCRACVASASRAYYHRKKEALKCAG